MSLLKRDKNNKHTHNPIRHLLHMIICCGLPMLIILALPFIARLSPALAGVLGVISPFICPLMMGGMMLMMLRSKKSDCCKEEAKENYLPK